MRALDGVLVLDLCRRYPGAYSSTILGDFGAEVIKVDPPGSILPAPKYQSGERVNIDSDTEEFAARFAPDRNKKSIILNLKTESGKRVFLELAKKADVIVESFRPEVMRRLGLDYEALSKMNQRLIYCAQSAFGVDGPYVQRPAHDQNIIGLAGLLSLIGPKNGAPCMPSNFLGDIAGAALHGAIGILLALVARERTGKGQFVDISYLDAAISLEVYDASYFFMTNKSPRRHETYNTGGSPYCNVYKCKDGEYVVIACFEPHLWANLVRLLGREDLIPYQDSPENDRVIRELEIIFITKTREEWVDFFKDKDVCFAPVNYLHEAFVDPQVIHRGMVVNIDHPKFNKVKQIGVPIKLSDTTGEIRSLGVALGANTEEIIRSLGYRPSEITKFRQEGAVA